jgi:hypothetical protein
MILDATAGNRTIWQNKDNESIIYIDMEKQLQRKPTIFADNTTTPFFDKFFSTIFYDPPHDFGGPPFDHKLKLSAETAEFIKHHPFCITYYGWDKYKNQMELIVHMYQAQKEFHRILADDGLLWFKWCEIKITLQRALVLFEDWQILMVINLADPTKTWGKKKSFWVCLAKEKRDYLQTTLG